MRFDSFLTTLALSLSLLASAGCDDGRSGPGVDVDSGTMTDPSCWEPRSIVPGTTCGSARPDVVCPGSCAQTLDGVVGVGLSSCRCMDDGTGFGARWICDLSACDAGGSDGGLGLDAGTSDAGGCPPSHFEPPAEPGCTAAQYDEITRIETQADYDAFASDPDNRECSVCITQAVLACATDALCEQPAGDLNCCVDAHCPPDDPACVGAAVEGPCASAADTLDACVYSASWCAFIPAFPPGACFP